MEIIYQKKALTQAIISNRSKNEIILLDKLVYLSGKFKEIYISQSRLAEYLKVSRATINRKIKELVRDGCILVEYRGVKKTLLYKVNPIIFTLSLVLSSVLLSLTLTTKHYIDTLFRRSVTQDIKGSNNYNFPSSIVHPVHPNLFINSCNRSSAGDSLWGISYQQFIFHGNGEFDRSIPNDYELENFKKILEEVEMTREELFWDGLVKALKLSQHGLIKLQVFPITVVNASYKKLQQQSKIYDKIKWLIRECDTQCKNEGRPVQWSKYYDSLRSLGIDQGSSLIEQDQIDFLDFSKPALKEPEIYSTRDLDPYKKQMNPETLQKGLLFLGDILPKNVQEDVKYFIKTLPIQSDV